MVKVLSKIAEPVISINDVSRITSGVNIVGDITSPGDIRIDGHVEGKIHCDGKIVVGEDAFLKGTVECPVLDVWGKIEGEVIVTGQLSLKNTSVIEGNIRVKKFQVELGAVVNGTFQMLSEPQE